MGSVFLALLCETIGALVLSWYLVRCIEREPMSPSRRSRGTSSRFDRTQRLSGSEQL